jgi:hypothetical protein
MDQLAFFIGYAFIYLGAVLLSVAALTAMAWTCTEYAWKRYGDWKTLREFMEWKHGRYPG